MSKNEQKEKREDRHLARFDIFEFDTEDGGTDHRIEAMFAYGGLELRYDTTFDKVRQFFTEARRKRVEKQKQAQLALVEEVEKK